MTPTTDTAVRRSITVRAGADRAFRVFTEGIDSWWPKSHHIGSSPLKQSVIEPRVGGRCYGRQEDGTDCPWGEVLVWDPPRRFLMAWRVTPDWKYEPDLAKCSEVEVLFTPLPNGSTKVDLEHRYFERHGAGWQEHAGMVANPDGGWGGLLKLFAAAAEQA